MINFLSAKVAAKEIGTFTIKDETQGWDETWRLKYLPETRKSRCFEEGQELAAQTHVKPLGIGLEQITCSVRDCVAAVFVSQAMIPDQATGDKYEPVNLLEGMSVSSSLYTSVYEAYGLICRDGEAVQPDEDEEAPKA